MSTAANPKAHQTHPSDAPQESTGTVASDSLAAESIKADGGFAENENAAISSVKGSNSTLNNTDTSGASVLQPAADGSAREKQEAKGQGSDEKGVSGVKYPDADSVKFDGIHSSEGYVGGPSGTGSGSGSGSGGSDVKSAFAGASGDSFADGAGPTSSGESGGPLKGVSSGSEAAKKATTSDSSTFGSSGSAAKSSGSTSGSGSYSKADVADAPNYAATVSGALRPEGEDKPKGKNLTEGGIPETKTFTGDVGGQHDPGRLAEQEFQTVSAGNAASAAEKQHEGGAGELTGGKFDVLTSERA